MKNLLLSWLVLTTTISLTTPPALAVKKNKIEPQVITCGAITAKPADGESILEIINNDKLSVLVIDARPNQIKSAKGATKYKRKGTVVITNMNPFIYDYRINVVEKPFSDAAILSFLKLAIPGAEALIKEAAPSRISLRETLLDDTRRSLDALIAATAVPPTFLGECASDTQAPLALKYLRGLRDKLVDYYDGRATTGTGGLKSEMKYLAAAFAEYEEKNYYPLARKILSPHTETRALCAAKSALEKKLDNQAVILAEGGEIKLNRLSVITETISEMTSLNTELATMIGKFRVKYPNCQPVANGFDYVDFLSSLSTEFGNVIADLRKQSAEMSEQLVTYAKMKQAIEVVTENEENGALGRVFQVGEDYEGSDVTIEIVRTARDTRALERGEEVGSRRDSGGGGGGDTEKVRAVNAEPKLAANWLVAPAAQQGEDAAGKDGTPPPTTVKLETGDGPRFTLSLGFMRSALEQRDYQPVLGFARDADGNLTDGRNLTYVLGLKEDSKNYVSPLFQLNTRLTNFGADRLTFNNFHLSLGVTGKRTDNTTDIGYFIGPSASFLRNRLFLSYGAFGDKQRRIAGDAFLGAKVEKSDMIPTRKEFHWKSGFSFTYKLPIN
ncbi:MAG: hypothetical protein M3430_00545 [Acidobacteriota bacterium]|nr:hypothetical protein [Acidobacteriota bacterium]